MDFERLKQNLTDVIKEEQLKLGYRPEVIRLYYPLSSVNHFLGGQYSADQATALLSEFCGEVREQLGEIEVSSSGGRFCFAIPEKGAAYVHEHTGDNEFIKKLIAVVQKHGCTMDDVMDVFRSVSDRVHAEKLDNGEFDWLIYFEDGMPDGYYYCFTSDGHHTMYHRFLPEDYADFGF